MKDIKSDIKDICLCCGNAEFNNTPILWQELIDDWQLSKKEKDYINIQQGMCCTKCGCNIRSIVLASAIMNQYSFTGIFKDFIKEFSQLKILQINEAGQLNQFLELMENHILVSYPKVDMLELPFKEECFDLVVHSDTLEHISEPVKALKETRRVLKSTGKTCYTVPVIIDRLTKDRKGLKPSYHGSPGNDEYLVNREYGSDFWKELLNAGYSQCSIFTYKYPSGIAIVGSK